MFTKDVIIGIMASMYFDEQVSCITISKRFGCAAMTIKNWLVKDGYKLRPKGRIPGKKLTRALENTEMELDY